MIVLIASGVPAGLDTIDRIGHPLSQFTLYITFSFLRDDLFYKRFPGFEVVFQFKALEFLCPILKFRFSDDGPRCVGDSGSKRQVFIHIQFDVIGD